MTDCRDVHRFRQLFGKIGYAYYVDLLLPLSVVCTYHNSPYEKIGL